MHIVRSTPIVRYAFHAGSKGRISSSSRSLVASRTQSASSPFFCRASHRSSFARSISSKFSKFSSTPHSRTSTLQRLSSESSSLGRNLHTETPAGFKERRHKDESQSNKSFKPDSCWKKAVLTVGIAGMIFGSVFTSLTQDKSSASKAPEQETPEQEKEHTAADHQPVKADSSSTALATQSQSPHQKHLLKGRPVVIVVGASGNIGKEIVVTAIAQGNRVIATSRTPSDKGLAADLQSPNELTIVQTPDKETHDPEFWKNFFLTHIKAGDDVIVVSTIGGAHGNDLRRLNIEIPVAVFTGLQAAKEHIEPASLRARHCSSIAASMKLDAYGCTKRESDESLLQLDTQIFRIGYVIDDCGRAGMAANPHAYTPLQIMASPIPFHPVMGDETIPLQPVHISDVADALVSRNSSPHEEPKIVDAVGPEILTQGQIYNLYATLLDRPYRPVYISLDAARLLAKHHSKGHFCSYAVEYCEKFRKGEQVTFSHKSFEDMLGRPLTKLEEIYSQKPEEIPVLQAPIVEHMKEIFSKTLTDSQAACDTLKAVGIQVRHTLTPKSEK